MKNFHASNFLRIVNPADFLAHFERARIPSRSHHHTNRSIRRPAEVALADPAINRSFERLYQITLQAHENRLGLRIAKTAVELEHHRSTRRHHQSAVEDALVVRALRLHSRHHRTRNVLQQPVLHLRVYHRLSGIGAHAAGVRTRITLAHSLVILRGGQRGYAFAVAQHQKRKLFAFQALLDHDAGSCLAQHLPAEHLRRHSRSLFFALADHDALARS